MPSLPVVSGAEAVRALQRLGFVIARLRGSHLVLRRRISRLRCAHHRGVKTGTLSGLLKQAGVSVDDFVNALKA